MIISARCILLFSFLVLSAWSGEDGVENRTPAKPAIDLLNALNPADQSFNGEWTLADGVLLSRHEKGKPYSLYRLPYHPGNKYDFHLVFKRTHGNNNVGPILVWNGQQVLLGTAASNKTAGLSLVDGVAASKENVTSIDNALENGVSYDLLVAVREQSIKAVLNGKPICDFHAMGEKLSLDGEMAIPDSKSLGLVVRDSEVEFSKIEVTDLSGDGCFVKVVNTLAQKSAALNVKGKTFNLLEVASPTDDALRCNWVLEDGALRSTNGGAGGGVPLFRLPVHPGPEYDLHVVFVRDTGDDSVCMLLPINGVSAQFILACYANKWGGFEKIDGQRCEKNPTGFENSLENGRQYDLKIQIRRGSVLAILDGKTVSELQTAGHTFGSESTFGRLRDHRALGMFAWNSNATFKTIEFTDISGAAEFYRPDFIADLDGLKKGVPPTPSITKGPLPSAESQKEVTRAIREVFKADFAKTTPQDKFALAMKLDKNAAVSPDDPASRYVLLSTAATLAAQAGEFEFLIATLTKLAAQFDTDLKVLRKTCLATIATSVRDARLSKVISAMKLLEDVPNDPIANQTVGRHFCFTARQWEVGLPFLAKAPIPALKELAQAELSVAADPGARAVLAEKWWNTAEKTTDNEEKAHYLERSAYWYRMALPGLTGLQKTRAEARMRGATAGLPPPAKK